MSTPLSGIGGLGSRLSIGGIGPSGDSGMRPLSIGGAIGGGNGLSFGDTLKQALNQVSGMQEQSSDAIAAFLRGDQVELHQVMAASEEAGIALDALIEIRNKLTDAYRSVMNMQS